MIEARSVTWFLYFLAHCHIVHSESRISLYDIAYGGGSMTGTGKQPMKVSVEGYGRCRACHLQHDLSVYIL